MVGKDPFRILLVEDHTILRHGLRSILSSEPDLEIVGEAEDGLKGIRAAQDLEPDLVLMDLSMPKMDGLQAMREIKRSDPEIKVLALTVHKSDEYIIAALNAGANGYVLKDSTQSELLGAIRDVLGGRFFLSPEVSEKVIGGFIDANKGIKKKSAWDTLTSREREILKLIAEGFKNREIGDYLCISIKTVEKHRANLMQKLDLHTVAALTALALEKGLIGEYQATQIED
jgi:DNA-binding NarL/FixJ family response regulator